MSDDFAPGDEAGIEDFVRGLVSDLAGTSVTRLELQYRGVRVRLRRAPGLAPVARTADESLAVGAVARPATWHAIEAPLTGIFYGRPAPDKDPYVTVGSHVTPDEVVGLIETMKMFNEITAEYTGTVREVLVENGSIVEGGQVLMYIEPGDDEHTPPIGTA